MTIKSRIRTVPNFPKKGIMFRDISTLISDPEGLQIMVKNFQERYQNRDNIDLVVGVEARGFIIGSLLAYALNKGFIMIRKPGKLPGHTITEEYQLEYGIDKMEIHSDAFKPKTKILLVDDLIATGGTIMAAVALIEKLGGIILETAFIVDLPDLGGSKQLTEQGYKIFSLVKFGGH
tara:strand:- start:409 stop:939 length:531 start_codon:yes stop_codon:yes gene_type:complete